MQPVRTAIWAAAVVVLLTLSVYADRYDDLMTAWLNRYKNSGIGSCTSTDAMTLAWNCMGAFHGACYAYEVSKDPVIMDRLYDCLNNNVVGATRVNAEGNVAYLYPDGTEEAGETFRILEGILHWVYLVKTNSSLHTKYLTIANQYLDKVENQIVSWWVRDYFIEDADDPDMPHDYHYPGSAMIVVPEHAGYFMSSPNNKLSDFGVAMTYLYKITGKAEYLEIIRKAALRFKSILIWQNGGEYYSWHYFDPFWKFDFTNYTLGGLARHGSWIEHRGGYGAINMKFMAEAYRLGLVWNRTDLQRLVKTNRDIMYNGGNWLLNDGSVPPDDWYGSLYPALCPYDPTGQLANIGYNDFNANLGSWGGQCDAPYFVYIMKLPANELNPPDTMSWVGPLEAINVEPISPSQVRLTFYNPLDITSPQVLSNYALSRGLTALAADVDPGDNRIVTVTFAPQAAGVALKLRVRGVKDIYGNQTFAFPLTNQPYNFTVPAASSVLLQPGTMARLGKARLFCFPSPARDAVRLWCTGQASSRPVTFRVCNARGEAVFTRTCPWQEAISGLTWDHTTRQGLRAQPGVYVVELENGQQCFREKLILLGK